ncbi:hypothetical protein Dda_4964 [Drechslerella dactyloides]|uniref:Uncharacterized protein n=1 Tax=Drechslerella dactyloides TaxID=74499 RepID=A0AAD6IXV7_DREDA|nr:hypothetical protein Dda_4964 [Drechslerella dactyloides]
MPLHAFRLAARAFRIAARPRYIHIPPRIFPIGFTSTRRHRAPPLAPLAARLRSERQCSGDSYRNYSDFITGSWHSLPNANASGDQHSWDHSNFWRSLPSYHIIEEVDAVPSYGESEKISPATTIFTESSTHDSSLSHPYLGRIHSASLSSDSQTSHSDAFTPETEPNSDSSMAAAKANGMDAAPEPNPFADPLNWYWIWYNNCLSPEEDDKGPRSLSYYPPPKNMGEALKVALLMSGIEITRVGQAFLNHRSIVGINSTELTTSTVTNLLKNLEFIWDNKTDPKDSSTSNSAKRRTMMSTAPTPGTSVPPQVTLQEVFKKKAIQWKTWKALHLLMQRSPMFEKFMLESAEDFGCDPERPRINIREPLACKLWRVLQIMVRFGLIKVPGGEFIELEKPQPSRKPEPV